MASNTSIDPAVSSGTNPTLVNSIQLGPSANPVELTAHCEIPAKPVEPSTPEAIKKSAAALRAKWWREKQKQNNPEFNQQEAQRKATERAEDKRIRQIKEIVNSNPNPPFVMTGAPQGKGLLITGGYDAAKMEGIAAQGKKEHGRRVRPGGVGASSFEKNDGAKG